MIRYYDLYKHLIGLDYDDGNVDCYGLCRRFYKDTADIDMPDYGRSADFFRAGIDLIGPFLLEEGFTIVDVPLTNLQFGDGLLLAVEGLHWPRGRTNHVGVYVGNQTILHHLYKRPSGEDPLDAHWRNRVTGVVRHPAMTLKNAERFTNNAIDFFDILPEHIRRKFVQVPPASVLEPSSGTSGADPSGQQDGGTPKRKRPTRSSVPGGG